MRTRCGMAIAVLLLAGCVAYTPEEIVRPPRNVRAARPEAPRERAVAVRPAATPLVIEAVLLPGPDGTPPEETPARRMDYIRELKECHELGASIVRVQPIAADSGMDAYRFDRSLANYRALIGEVLQAAPDVIIDLDLEGAPPDVQEWAQCNERIELATSFAWDRSFVVASGNVPLTKMKHAIARGKNLRLGLHESTAWPYKGRATNLDYLRQALALAREAGRAVATPAEARALLNIPPLRQLYLVPSSEMVERGKRFFMDAIMQPIREPFRAYLVVIPPSGQRRSMLKSGKIVRGVHPFAGGKGSEWLAYKTLINTTLKPDLSKGEYTFYLGLFSPRALVRPGHETAITKTSITVE